MITEVLFVCTMGMINKNIVVMKTDSVPVCSVAIDNKIVGKAQHDKSYCEKLALKVKTDLERKGYKCETKKVSDQPTGKAL